LGSSLRAEALIYSAAVSEREESGYEREESAEPRMRRRLFGYKPADVAEVLEARDSELSELEDELDDREAELTQLRQDIAALWLAFAQHDRMIRDLTEVVAATGAAARAAAEAMTSPAVPSEADVPAAPEQEPLAVDEVDEEDEPTTPATPATEDIAAAQAEAPDPSVRRQLADLDEVLAAIEMATQTLEQTYADEIDEGEATAEPAEAAEAESEPSDGD